MKVVYLWQDSKELRSGDFSKPCAACFKVGEGNETQEAKSDSEEESEDDDEPDKPQLESAEGQEATAAVSTTRSGRAVKPRMRWLEESEQGLGAISNGYEIKLTDAEEKFYDTMQQLSNENCDEYGLVGAGIGGGFASTTELHVMKFDQAMASNDKEKWENAVQEEHERFERNRVFVATSIDQVPKDAKILTSTWAMKKKASGKYRARLNARGFEQIDGEHYDEAERSSPTVNITTIYVMLVIMIMARYIAHLADVHGAFLLGHFDKDRHLYMYVPQGFERFYPKNVVLKLQRTIYGLVQAALMFWKEVLKAFYSMGYKRSKADPCLYFKWVDSKLILWLSWIDDCLVIGDETMVPNAKKEFMDRFESEDNGEMSEYIGAKMEYNREEGWLKMTQPVLLQSFSDEFDLPYGDTPRTPAAPGTVLTKSENDTELPPQAQAEYRKGVGKLLHLMRRSRPEMLNSVRELSKFMQQATWAHMTALYRAMKYCTETPKRGWVLQPNESWDGDPSFEFKIRGKSDSDFAKDPTRKSVSGNSTFLCGAPVCLTSRQQNIIALSVTEAELISAVSNVQDMLFVMRLIESIGLKVQKPMQLEVDNKGVVDLVNGWSVGGRTRHIDTRLNFLRELKENNILKVNWCSNQEMSSDLFTKNLQGPDFERHANTFCGSDEYQSRVRDSQGEGVGMSARGEVERRHEA